MEARERAGARAYRSTRLGNIQVSKPARMQPTMRLWSIALSLPPLLVGTSFACQCAHKIPDRISERPARRSFCLYLACNVAVHESANDPWPVAEALAADCRGIFPG